MLVVVVLVAVSKSRKSPTLQSRAFPLHWYGKCGRSTAVRAAVIHLYNRNFVSYSSLLSFVLAMGRLFYVSRMLDDKLPIRGHHEAPEIR